MGSDEEKEILTSSFREDKKKNGYPKRNPV